MEQEVNQYQPMSVGDWVLTLMLTAIPLIYIIMLFVWVFNKNTHPSKVNFAKANLIMIALVIGIFAVIFAIKSIAMQ